MMRPWKACLLAMVLASCRMAPQGAVHAPGVPMDLGSGSAQGAAVAALAELPAKVAPAQVVVSIQWPGGGERTTQLMPDSVQGVRVSVEREPGVPLASRWVQRGRAAVTTVALDVPSGEGYRIRAVAHAGWSEVEPGAVLAEGLATQVAVPWGRVARVTLDLQPVNQPNILALDVPAAGAGATLSIEVAGVGTATDGVVVFPSGATQEVAFTADAAVVKVPQDAGVGPLRLRVDGVLSTEGPLFRQLQALRILAQDNPQGELLGPRTDPDDQAVHLWPGAAAPLAVAGTDVDGGDVAEVKGVAWSRAQTGPYTLAKNGRVECSGLGRGRVRATSGAVSVERDLELAPFEGAIVQVSEDKDESNLAARAVVLDENRLLVLWRNDQAAKFRWRILNRMPDGSVVPAGPVQETSGAGLPEEKSVAAAVGKTKVLFLHRRGVTSPFTGKNRNTFAIRALDIQTGALLPDPSVHITPSATDSEAKDIEAFRLGAVAAQGDNFQLVYSKWTGIQFETNWANLSLSPVDGKLSVGDSNGLSKAFRSPMVDNPDVMPLTDGGYLMVFTYGDAQSNVLQLRTMTATGSTDFSRTIGYSYDRPIYQPSVAADDNNFLVARYTDGTAGPSLEVARYKKTDLTSLDVQPVLVEAVNQPSWVVSSKPTSTIYDKTADRFLVGYSRAIPGVVPSGVTEGYQAVVRLIRPDTAKAEGPAFPMQTRSHSGTVVPGWAVYIRDGAVLARRLKLQ